MLKKIAFAAVGTLLLISPLSVSADTASDIQAQIQSLLAQLQGLKTQLLQLQNSGSDTTVRGNGGVNSAAPPSTDTPSACPVITRALAFGASGEDVQALQEFLRSQGVFSDEVTGFFGAHTEAALQAWQAKRGIVADGDPESTGWGVFGPASRAWLAHLCNGNPGNGNPANDNFTAFPRVGGAPLTVFFTVSHASSTAGYTVNFGDGASGSNWQADTETPGIFFVSHTYSADGSYTATLMGTPACPQGLSCTQVVQTLGSVTVRVGPQGPPVQCTILDCAAGSHASGPSCSRNQTCIPNSPGTTVPNVSGVDGPAALAVGQAGTWTVHAAISNNADTSLHYSVIWGDEGILGQISAFAAGGQSGTVQNSATFTHAYASAGTYKPTFFVTNNSGSTQASISVVVSSGNPTGVGCAPGPNCAIGFPPAPTTPPTTPGPVSGNLTVTPNSGLSPLTVTFVSSTPGIVNFGDGTSGSLAQNLAPSCSGIPAVLGTAFITNCAFATASPYAVTHTYFSAGTYTASLTNIAACAAGSCAQNSSVVVTVTGGNSGSNINLNGCADSAHCNSGVSADLKDSQFANALSALEWAIKALAASFAQ